MKKLKIILVAILVLPMLFGSCQNKQETIKIGAVFPLTGEAAKYGQNMQRGIELAQYFLRDSIQKSQIEIIYEDSKANAAAGVSAVNKIISNDKVPAFITFASDVVLSSAPIAEKNKVVLLNCLAQSPAIRNAGDFVFSNINDANVESYQMAEYIFDTLKINRIGIIYCSKSYGVGTKDAMEFKFKELGGTVVSIQEFTEGNRDFRKQIENFKKYDIPAIFLIGVSNDLAYFQRQAYEQNYKPRWFSFTSYEGAEVFSVAGVAAENTIFTSTAFDINENKEAQIFINEYKQKYNEIPDVYAATGFDSYMLIYNAIKDGAKTGEQIKNYFYQMQAYKGITGITKFDSDGCVNKPVKFKIVKNSQFEFLR